MTAWRILAALAICAAIPPGWIAASGWVSRERTLLIGAVAWAWLPAVACLARFWWGALHPALPPREIAAERVLARTGGYDLVLSGGRLLATFAHQPTGNGVAVIDVATGASTWAPVDRDSYLYATALGKRAIVHDKGRQLEVDLSTGTAVEAPAPAPWFRSDVTGELLIEREWPILWWRSVRIDLGLELFAPDEVRLDADGRTAWVRGDCGNVLARVDLASGEVAAIPDRRFSWGLAPRDGGGVYETHAVAGRVVMRDSAGRIERERWIGGFPRMVQRLDGTPWIAVGMYLGRAIVLLDAQTLDPVARIPAATGVRGVLWDDARAALWWVDAAGVERAALR